VVVGAFLPTRIGTLVLFYPKGAGAECCQPVPMLRYEWNGQIL
jgi:hypothetical protein